MINLTARYDYEEIFDVFNNGVLPRYLRPKESESGGFRIEIGGGKVLLGALKLA